MQKLNLGTKKIAIGLSGGVDSALSAHLLVEAGHDVTGVYLECWKAPGCRSEEDRQDALEVALQLKIPFVVLDFKDAYRNKVVQYFFDTYRAGKTPNPDTLCNAEIKFGLFYDWAIKSGFDAVATGHYASVKNIAGVNRLVIPRDAHKDQTYFLYLLRSEQLDHIYFPLEKYTKHEVREEAAKRSIHVAKKKDSVGICFIGDIDVKKFLSDELGENPGDVVDTDGTVIGSHDGLWFYTIGQRHGFSIEKHSVIQKADGSQEIRENFPPYYVVEKQPKNNQLVVGFGSHTKRNMFAVSQLHWLTKPAATSNVLVRIRHTGELLPASLLQSEDECRVDLQEPVAGIAPGQAAVFYESSEGQTVLLGGGVIK